MTMPTIAAADRRIAVIGLGYVGLPVAVAFGRQAATSGGPRVLAFDINTARIAALRAGHDATGEVPDSALAAADLHLTADPADLADADFFIVAVPTPIDDARQPDLRPLLGAARTVGQAIRPGAIVVFESTVYPGATEEDCVPVLERESGLVVGRDFAVGYSPERINPGDTVHRFETITKVVAGSDPATADIIAAVYGRVVTAGVYRATSIKVAEAAKVIENTQRDLNIALMNELALIFRRLGIDTRDVLAAAGTKWNFLPFTPGLVGGHCIGVDPYYLTHRAERAGYHPEVVLAGRRINDSMGRLVAQEAVRLLLRHRRGADPVVTILGLTFKEDVPDTRNTRVVDVAAALADSGVRLQLHDPVADPHDIQDEYGASPIALADLAPADAVILAVPHREVKAGGWALVTRLLKAGRGPVLDVRAALDRDAVPDGIELWRL